MISHLTNERAGKIADAVQRDLVDDITKRASCLDHLIDFRLCDYGCPDDQFATRRSGNSRSRLSAQSRSHE